MKKQSDRLSKNGKRLTLLIPQDVFAKLSEIAKQEQLCVGTIVRKWIIEALAKA